MRWRLFTILSLFSLLIGAATAGLWFRSYFVRDRFSDLRYMPYAPLGGTDPADDDGKTLVERFFNFMTAGGKFVVQHWRSHSQKVPWIPEEHWALYSTRNDLVVPGGGNIWHLGFRVERELSPGHDLRTVVIPLWCVVLTASMLPVWWIYRWRRRIAIASIGCCKKCGDNLTGNSSGNCPECGATLNVKSAVERFANS